MGMQQEPAWAYIDRIGTRLCARSGVGSERFDHSTGNV